MQKFEAWEHVRCNQTTHLKRHLKLGRVFVVTPVERPLSLPRFTHSLGDVPEKWKINHRYLYKCLTLTYLLTIL